MRVPVPCFPEKKAVQRCIEAFEFQATFVEQKH